MKKKSITRRFGLAYALSTLTILLGAIMLYFALNNSYLLVKSMADVYSPSSELLQRLSFKISETKMLIKNWVFVSPQPNSPDKIRLKQLQEDQIPKLFTRLNTLSIDWETDEQLILQHLELHFQDSLLPAQRKVMQLLTTFEDYNNPMLVFEAQSMVEDENDEVMMVTNGLLSEISTFMDHLSGKVVEVREEAKKSMNAYKLLIIFIALSTGLGTFLLASFINRSIIKPLKDLDLAASLVQEGNFDIRLEVAHKN